MFENGFVINSYSLSSLPKFVLIKYTQVVSSRSSSLAFSMVLSQNLEPALPDLANGNTGGPVKLECQINDNEF